MPRIKLTAIVAGPDYRGQPGEIIEVSIQHAQQLIMARAALPLEPDGPPASHDEGRATGPGPAEAGNGKPDVPTADLPAEAEGAADAPAAKPAKKPKK